TNNDGTLVRLKDVGRAELGAEDYVNQLQFNGRDAVGLFITQLSTANAIEVDRRAIAELDNLSKRFPPGLKYELAFDTTDAVNESIKDVLYTPGGPAQHHHPVRYDSGLAHRDLRLRQAAGLLH